MTPSPDLAARRVLMSCYLYYARDVSVLSDRDYDALTLMVGERWDEVEPIRQWQLGSPAEIAATGYHVKITSLTIAGAEAWFRAACPGADLPPDIKRRRWRTNKKFTVRWSTL